MSTISVAPAGAPIGSPDFVDVSESFESLAISMGLTAREADRLAAIWAGIQANLSPKEELKFRLTERANGRDPGKPRTWRGL